MKKLKIYPIVWQIVRSMTNANGHPTTLILATVLFSPIVHKLMVIKSTQKVCLREVIVL